MSKSVEIAEDMGFLMASSYKDGPAFKVKEFHEWKSEQRQKDAPIVRQREWYYSEYGRYCEKCRRKLKRMSNERDTRTD